MKEKAIMKPCWSHGTAGRHKTNVAQQQLTETNRATFKVKLMKRQGDNVADVMIIFLVLDSLIEELCIYILQIDIIWPI